MGQGGGRRPLSPDRAGPRVTGSGSTARCHGTACSAPGCRRSPGRTPQRLPEQLDPLRRRKLQAPQQGRRIGQRVLAVGRLRQNVPTQPLAEPEFCAAARSAGRGAKRFGRSRRLTPGECAIAAPRFPPVWRGSPGGGDGPRMKMAKVGGILKFTRYSGRRGSLARIQMNTGMIGQGSVLMLVGMGAVFVFLSVLVSATSLMSYLVMRMQPGPDAPGAAPEEIAAITAAIARYRNRSR